MGDLPPGRTPISPLPARLLILLLLALPCTVEAGTFVVDTTVDDPALSACDDAAPNDCSLRGAILAANERPLSETSTINVPAGTYVVSRESPCTFSVQPNPAQFFTSTHVPLCLSKQVIIQGAGAATTIIDGDRRVRALFVSASAVAELRGVTIANGLGDRSFGNPTSIPLPHGGGIMNEGTLTLTDSVVRTNSVPAGGFNGGGIYNDGVVTLLRSAVSDNVSPDSQLGGGILNNPHAILTVSESIIRNNIIGGSGGGIFNNGGVVTITNSTVSGNTPLGGGGGGIANGGFASAIGTLTVVNSTISGNRSGSSGGGIATDNGDLTDTHLNNVTITDNTGAVADRGAGGGVAGKMFLQNTVIAGNRDAFFASTPDCAARLISQGYNLIQNTTGCVITGDLTGNIVGQDAQLGLLGDYGGPTKTHALLAGSPAIDAGNPAAPGSGGLACTATDQRGFNRLQDGDGDSTASCDIGAFELLESSAGFSLFSIWPDRGGNSGAVVALVYGSGFAPGATVKLTRAGQADIVGNPMQGDVGGAAIAATFDLVGQAIGSWDVVVRNPDGTSKTLAAGFAIEAGRAPELWVDILGPRLLRSGRPARLTLLYGNRGNVDAVGVPLSFSLPAGYAPRRFFAMTPPPPQAGQVRDDWSQVPVNVLTDAASGFTNVPLLLQVVPAGFTGILQIELTSLPGAQDRQLQAALGDPLFTPGLDAAVVSDAVAGAQAYLLKEGVTVPPALVPDLEQYVTNQFQRVKEGGHAAFVANLGTQPQVYSMSQLHLDLVFFAAAQTAEDEQAVAVPEDWLFTTYRFLVSLVSKLETAKAQAQRQNCPVYKKGDVLPGGCSGGGGPNEPFLPPAIPPPPGCNLKDPSTFKNCKATRDHCESLPGYKVVTSSTGEPFCVPEKPGKECSKLAANPVGANQGCTIFPLRPRGSFDPNDKVGTLGATPAQFLLNATSLNYTVFFENLESATAAAQEVVITDQLDVQTMDLDTFSLGPLSFGGNTTLVPAPGVQQYTGGVDLRPDQNLIVTIIAGLDKTTGVLTWRFTSIDPDTGQFTEDPEAGFLPPNVHSPEGEGSVVFTVQPKPGLATGTQIRNRARIVFDTNAPIDTPEWLNTIDASAPSSHVLPLASTRLTTGVLVEWAGTDDGAGILDYSIFVSVDGGPFTAFVTDTTDTSATFTGELGKTYAFYSTARDLAGNIEERPAVPDAMTHVGFCVGDCSGTQVVAISDLITLVNIALDTAQAAACVNGIPPGAQVDIALIIQAVGNALNGCGPGQ